MPKNRNGNIISYHQVLQQLLLSSINNFNNGCPINNCTSSGLTELNQDSPNHLRFIPQCLDIDHNLNRTYNLIVKTPNALLPAVLSPNNQKTLMKRETFLEFKVIKNSLRLILVTSNPNIVTIASNLNITSGNNQFNIQPATRNRKYFHLKSVRINTGNINAQISIFLNLINLLYP